MLLSVPLKTPIASPLNFLAGMAIVLSSLPAWADDQPGVTPYRPSVSFSAQISAPGRLELELGAQRSKTGDTLRDSVPYDLKLGINSEWGIRLEGEAYVSELDGGGNRISGGGDTAVVIKHAFLIDETTALGLEFGTSVPHSSATTAGSGKTDHTVNGIVSKDIGSLHLDANLYFTRLGVFDFDTARIQTGWAVAFSAPVAGKFGAIAELSGTRRYGAPSTAQLLLATTYSPNKQMAIDFGVSKAFNNASQNWEMFTGIVVPIGKLW